MNDTSKSHPAILLQILVGLLGLAAVHGLAFLLVRVSFGLAMAWAFIGAFGVPFTLSYRRLLKTTPAIVLGLLSVYLGAVCVLTHSVFQLLPMGSEVQLEDVSKAPGHDEAGVLVFETNGRALPDYTGEFTDRSGRYDDVYQVHPIVPHGWTKDQPVPLWQGQVSTPTTESHAPRADSVAVVTAFPDLYGKAIADAERRFGLKSASSAPVIQWVPRKVLDDRALLAHILAFGTYFGWVVGAAFALLIGRRKPPSRRE